MSDKMDMNDFARAALYCALARSARLYKMLSERVRPPGLKVLLTTMADERSSLASTLVEVFGPFAEDSTPIEQESDDAARRVAAGPEAVFEIIRTRELDIRSILEDRPDGAFPDDLAKQIFAKLQASRMAMTTEMLTPLGSQGPRAEYRDRTFGLERMAPEIKSAAPQPRLYEVWFGTNRAPVRQGEKIIGFGSDRADDLTFGRCEVAIPETHKLGSIGSKWWHRIGHGDDRLRFATLVDFDRAACWDAIRGRLKASAKGGDAIIFLHGYNLSFEAAAIRAAQIGADLAIPGVMAFFSWPSRGRVLQYPADEATIEASEGHIARYLSEFAQQSGARAIHIVAHSMGNRGLLRAINRIAANVTAETGKPFGQIILAAPDVDSGIFRDLADAYAATALRATLYVSPADLAVRGSRLLHSADRIGFTPPIAIVPGIDTVNVTDVDLSWLGHGYVASARTVLTDIYSLIAHGDGPDERATLRRRGVDDQIYWEFAS
jgi:esterase/lipase superfamily enzyme